MLRDVTRDALIVLALAAALLAGVALWFWPVWTPPEAPVHIRWAPAATDALRYALEQELQLGDGTPTEGRTFRYIVRTHDREAIRRIVTQLLVESRRCCASRRRHGWSSNRLFRTSQCTRTRTGLRRGVQHGS
ncbi:MAG: hypothetical protein AB1635_01155 [Acidobacteriota bacterium]